MESLQLLRDLPEEALQQILDRMERVKMAPGEQLFCQGGRGTAIYAVESGALRVTRRLHPEDDEELEVTVLGPGACVGETALMCNTPPFSETVTVYGEESTRLWRLDRAAFLDVITVLASAPEEEAGCEVDFDDLDAPDPVAKSIFVVSDGTAEAAEESVTKALRLFEYEYKEHCAGVSVTNFCFVRYRSEVQEIARRAREDNALVVYTLMRQEPREAMQEEIARSVTLGEGDFRAVDLWEPMLTQMEVLLGIPRKPETYVPALRTQLSAACLRMVEAVEYTRKLDDGVKPELWHEADVILIGLSRIGKTPLSFFLAQRGLKVANYPMVLDEEPPPQLFDPGLQHKCIALTIDPKRLQAVREARMSSFGRSKSMYASAENCSKEVRWVNTFFRREAPHWPVLDMTNDSIEENAGKVLTLLKYSGSLGAANPSVM